MKNTIVVLCSVFFFILLHSCKDKSTQPTVPFEGITETVLDPTPIGSVDPDDWKPMMDCSSLPKVPGRSQILDTVPVVNPDTSNLPMCTKIYPAYPNPTTGLFTIEYSLNATDSVYITINDTPTHILQVLINEKLLRGVYTVRFDASNFNSGMYRVYITVVNQTTILHSYGDIKIVK